MTVAANGTSSRHSAKTTPRRMCLSAEEAKRVYHVQCEQARIDRIQAAREEELEYTRLAEQQVCQQARFADALAEVYLLRRRSQGRDNHGRLSSVARHQEALNTANARSAYWTAIQAVEQAANPERQTVRSIYARTEHHGNTTSPSGTPSTLVDFNRSYFHRSTHTGPPAAVVRRNSTSGLPAPNAAELARQESDRLALSSQQLASQREAQRLAAKQRGQAAVHKLQMSKQRTQMLQTLEGLGRQDARRRQELISVHIRTRNVEVAPPPQSELEQRFEDLFAERVDTGVKASGVAKSRPARRAQSVADKLSAHQVNLDPGLPLQQSPGGQTDVAATMDSDMDPGDHDDDDQEFATMDTEHLEQEIQRVRGAIRRALQH
ncbi:hypothetical protein RI367_007881 [Sorochytrium milnesiophthora]